jgi:hypothetical protein
LPIECPSWCVSNHSNYGERERVLGDLIWHEGETAGERRCTIEIGGDSPEPFTVQRVQCVTADGTVRADGYNFGSHFLTPHEAESLLTAFHRALHAA